MTGKERILKALRSEEPDWTPHFEIVFEREKEAFGLLFPDRNAGRGCSRADKNRMLVQCRCHIAGRAIALPCGSKPGGIQR